jgi:hypothetical protein
MSFGTFFFWLDWCCFLYPLKEKCGKWPRKIGYAIAAFIIKQSLYYGRSSCFTQTGVGMLISFPVLVN